jgi:ribose/xylose/arabinose/galactoside ABC-type transport system permease subunit
MAVGMTVVIIGGGIDISVGSIMGLAALGTAAVLQNMPADAPAWKAATLGVVIPVVIGLLCGLINGLIVVGLRVHPFIITLGTLSIFRWISLRSVAEGSLPSGDNVLPEAFTSRFIAYTMQWRSAQPIPMLIMLLMMVLGWIYLRWMVWGRETYAIGGNEQAAQFSGIRVQWVKIRTYLISGLCAGVAGMISCGYYKSAATNTGLGYELMVVAAAVVGGASLNGGRGTALGAVLGTLVIQLIDDGISILSEFKIGALVLHVHKEDTMGIVGAAIILAVAVDRFSEEFRQRRLARQGKRH